MEGQVIELHLQKTGKKVLLQKRLESPQNDLFLNQNIFEQSRKLDDQLVQSSKQDTLKELSVKSHKAYLCHGAASGRSELKWDDEKRFMLKACIKT